MAYSIDTYKGNGATVAFTITVPYTSEAEIEVYDDNVLQTADVDYTFTSATEITFTVAPTDEDPIEFRRVTEPETPIVDFTNGAPILESDLDNTVAQLSQRGAEVSDAVNHLYGRYVHDTINGDLDIAASKDIAKVGVLEKSGLYKVELGFLLWNATDDDEFGIWVMIHMGPIGSAADPKIFQIGRKIRIGENITDTNRGEYVNVTCMVEDVRGGYDKISAYVIQETADAPASTTYIMAEAQEGAKWIHVTLVEETPL